MKLKSVTVKLDESTHRWLKELAKANSKTQFNPGKLKPAQFLAFAAFCMADYAGRVQGASWEAEAARGMLFPGNFQAAIPAAKQDQLRDWEQRRLQ